MFFWLVKHFQFIKNFISFDIFLFLSFIYFLMIIPIDWASPVAQLVKNLLAVQDTWVRTLGWKDLLEKGKSTHSSILAWRIPWTIECMESQRVRHVWVTFTHFIFPWTDRSFLWNKTIEMVSYLLKQFPSLCLICDVTCDVFHR